MKLEVEGKVTENNPDSEEIVKALSSLDGENKSFAILSRTELTYIQAAGSAKDCFSLEYQNGSLTEHYCCSGDVSLEDTAKAFISYASGENKWQKTLKWEPMDIHPKGGIHLGKPKIDHSPLALLMYAFIGVCFFAVFLGTRKGANKQVWISLFLSSASLFVAAGTTQILRKGKYRAQFYTVTRSESPIQFWLAVIVGYLFSLAILALAILALAKRSG